MGGLFAGSSQPNGFTIRSIKEKVSTEAFFVFFTRGLTSKKRFHKKRFQSQATRIKIDRSPHDLHRTAVTHLARHKVPPEWRERIVNYLPKELDATYNLYEYDEEKETSMKRWEQELKLIFNQVDKPEAEN